MIKRLVEISSNYPDNIFAEKGWRYQALGTIFCDECRKINPDVFPSPIDIMITERFDKIIVGIIANANIDLFHIDFVAQIKDHLKDFMFGKCLLPDGTVIREYVTLYCKHWIFQRGSKQSKYNICGKCGSIAPNGWYGRQYVLRSCLTDTKIYRNSSGALYLDEELALQVDFSPWPDTELSTIDVRDEPMDEQVLPNPGC